MQTLENLVTWLGDFPGTRFTSGSNEGNAGKALEYLDQQEEKGEGITKKGMADHIGGNVTIEKGLLLGYLPFVFAFDGEGKSSIPHETVPVRDSGRGSYEIIESLDNDTFMQEMKKNRIGFASIPVTDPGRFGMDLDYMEIGTVTYRAGKSEYADDGSHEPVKGMLSYKLLTNPNNPIVSPYFKVDYTVRSNDEVSYLVITGSYDQKKGGYVPTASLLTGELAGAQHVLKNVTALGFDEDGAIDKLVSTGDEHMTFAPSVYDDVLGNVDDLAKGYSEGALKIVKNITGPADRVEYTNTIKNMIGCLEDGTMMEAMRDGFSFLQTVPSSSMSSSAHVSSPQSDYTT